MAAIHRQGGPLPPYGTVPDSSLLSMIQTGPDRWLYVDQQSDGPATYLYKHFALLESRIQYIQGGVDL